jgi:hypothetical protein
MGDISETEVEAGGLDLIVEDWFQRLDLTCAVDRVAQ